MFIRFQALPFLIANPESMGGFGITNTLTIGYIMVPASISQILFMPFFAVMAKKYGGRTTLPVGLIVMTITYALAAVFLKTETQVIIMNGATGIGMAGSMMSFTNALAESTSQREFGITTSMNSLFRVIANAVGATIAQVILNEHLVRYHVTLWAASWKTDDGLIYSSAISPRPESTQFEISQRRCISHVICRRFCLRRHRNAHQFGAARGID